MSYASRLSIDTAYHINNTDSVSNIQKVDQIKDLGILYDSHLTFQDHIGAVSGNGIIKINLLLHAFPVVTAKERNVISIAFRHRSVHDGHNYRGTTGQWS